MPYGHLMSRRYRIRRFRDRALREMLDVLMTVSFVAWRDGVVSCLVRSDPGHVTPLLGVPRAEETATYSVMLQFASAIHSMSSGYIRSCFPMYQSATGEATRECSVTLSSVASRYIAMYLSRGTVAVSSHAPRAHPIQEGDFIWRAAAVHRHRLLLRSISISLSATSM